MKNKELIEWLAAYAEHEGYDTIDADWLYEYLSEHKSVHSEKFTSHRWWDEYSVVVRVKHKLIQFVGASTTGDSAPEDVGWKFDSTSVCEVKSVEKTIVITEYVKLGETTNE